MKTMHLFVALAVLAVPSFGRPSGGPQLPPAFAAEPVKTQTGVASWYASGFIGRKTANGEIYRAGDKTAAHKSLPFGTWVRVTDQRSGSSTIVRINNRGPYVKGRVIDLSRAAAQEIGLTKRGISRVKLEILRPVPAGRMATANSASTQLALNAWFPVILPTNLPTAMIQ